MDRRRTLPPFLHRRHLAQPPPLSPCPCLLYWAADDRDCTSGVSPARRPWLSAVCLVLPLPLPRKHVGHNPRQTFCRTRFSWQGKALGGGGACLRDILVTKGSASSVRRTPPEVTTVLSYSVRMRQRHCLPRPRPRPIIPSSMTESSRVPEPSLPCSAPLFNRSAALRLLLSDFRLVATECSPATKYAHCRIPRLALARRFFAALHCHVSLPGSLQALLPWMCSAEAYAPGFLSQSLTFPSFAPARETHDFIICSIL